MKNFSLHKLSFMEITRIQITNFRLILKRAIFYFQRCSPYHKSGLSPLCAPNVSPQTLSSFIKTFLETKAG